MYCRPLPRCRTRVGVWLLAVALQAATARAASRPVTAHPTRPATVRVRDFARAHGFHVKWLEPDKRLQLSRNGLTLVLNANSREATVNGLHVWLLKPFEYRNPAGYLSQLDVDHVVYPLLYPPRNVGGRKVRHICLDPGHGGKDPGYRVGAHEEQRYTLALAYELKSQLAQAGFKVSLTRTGDEFVDLAERPQAARRVGADLFLSLHFNAAADNRQEVRGTEVYCLTPAGAASTAAGSDGPTSGVLPGNRHDAKNFRLAFELQKALHDRLQAEDRGVRWARFAVLRDATMPAALIEAGFLSHPDEGKRILDTAYRRRIAAAIVEGVQAYKRVVERR